MQTSLWSTFSRAAPALLLLNVLACQKKPPKVEEPGNILSKCDPLQQLEPLYCGTTFCGPNSPIINAFPYNGLHPDGCPSSDGASLKPQSLVVQQDMCPDAGADGLSLDTDLADRGPELGYELVGKDQNGAVRCRRSQLIGATFTMLKGQTATTLKISQIGLTGKSSPVKRIVYLITPEDQSTYSLCAHPGSDENTTATPVLGTTKNGELTPVEDEDLAAYAIIIPGAVYHDDATLIPRSLDMVRPRPGEKKPRRWFNIACTSDALAQTELSGLASAPIEGKLSAEDRLPALHMFTAKYCKGISVTFHGTPIKWSGSDRATSSDLGPLEAQWGPKGATCLSHSRLWIPNKIISLPPQLLGYPEFQNLKLPIGEEEFIAKLEKMCGDEKIPSCDESNNSDDLKSYTLNHDMTMKHRSSKRNPPRYSLSR